MNPRVYRLLLLALVLLFTISPPLTLQAQDGGPSDAELALVDRAFDALGAAFDYDSYTYSGSFDLNQQWTGTLNGAEVAGVTVHVDRSDDAAITSSAAVFNMQQTGAISQEVTQFDGTAASFALEAEVRAVDGAVYFNGAYSEANDPNIPALPEGWTEVSDDGDFLVWPGLYTMMNGDISAAALEAGLLTTGEDLDTLHTAARSSLIRAGSEAVTLDDGSPGEVITLTIGREGIQALGVFGADPNEPVELYLLEQAEDPSLSLHLLLDQDGHYLGLDYTFTLAGEGFDIGGIGGAPEGFLLDFDSTQTFTARLGDINAPLELAAAPEIDRTVPVGFRAPLEAESPNLRWWNDRVFYEVFVRSFYDSDGDGIGDLPGLIEKLDYLNDGDPATSDDLGVTGLWLMPIAQSPSYHGYDVTDYYTIEEDYGSNEDFLRLMDEAHARGMVVIVDLVLNHTSSQHPWFLAAAEGDPAYEDYYIWSDEDLGWSAPWGGNVWHPNGDRYYFGLFWSGMPDLNYRTPEVTATMDDVIRFWLEDMGADGFRLDAIRHLIEDGRVMQNTPETLAWLETFHSTVTGINPAALTVGEVWDTTQAVAPYVGDRVDIAFEFDMADAILRSVSWGVNDLLYTRQNTVLDLYPAGQYATFLTNHDQNRVMSQLNGDIPAAKLAATLLLTSPGVPFIYYGEEIGMIGEKPDERIRTPMQWSGERARAGFTTGTPWESVQFGYSGVNVALEAQQATSLLNHYRQLVALRNEHDALRDGAMQLVSSSDEHVYAFLRYGADETLLVLVNLGDEVVTGYALSAPDSLLAADLSADLLLGEGEAVAPTVGAGGAFSLYKPLDELPPQSAFIIRLR